MPKGIPNKRYTPEFKKQVVEAVIQDGLSYQEAARNYEVQGHGRIQSWERIYLEEGAEGLAVERRGRKSTGRPKKLPDKVEEDLLAEVLAGPSAHNRSTSSRDLLLPSEAGEGSRQIQGSQGRNYQDLLREQRTVWIPPYHN